MAAVPIPTTNLASNINSKEGAIEVNTLPRVNTLIPSRSVVLRPNTSLSFPRTGAQTAEDVARARAVHVVLLYARFMSWVNAGPSTVVSPPVMPTRNAANA